MERIFPIKGDRDVRRSTDHSELQELISQRMCAYNDVDHCFGLADLLITQVSGGGQKVHLRFSGNLKLFDYFRHAESRVNTEAIAAESKQRVLNGQERKPVRNPNE